MSATNIVVQRAGALGDVILTTPIIRRLRRENPTASIGVLTAYGDVFANSPHLDISALADPQNVRHIMLDLAYERRPGLHIVQAYMQEAFGDLGEPDDLQQELFFPRHDPLSAKQHYVAVHAAVAGWANRTLPRATWRAVIDGLRKAELWPVLVGSPRDLIPDYPVTAFLSSNVLAQASFIDTCACFVGSDSAMLHVAGATDVPIVGIFTCALPWLRLPYRQGKLGGNCMAVVPDLDCIGCLHERPPPVTTEACQRGDMLCVSSVDPDEIIAAVLALVETNS